MAKKKPKTAVIVIIAAVVILAGFVLLKPKPEVIPGPYDNFIMCLKNFGAKMYGNYASKESLMQMSFFGDSLYTFEKSGVYVECNEYGPNPKTKKCNEAGINYYPTWIINEGRYAGIQGLNKLSQLTGCSYES